ncbi:MAG: uroporphyrinogen-III synthase [Thermoplasmataceae archaeon]
MSGRTLIVTRPEGKATEDLKCEGLEIINVPVTRLEDVPFNTDEFRSFNPDIVIVTSSRSADIMDKNTGLFGPNRIYVSIGRITRQALKSIGLDSVVPHEQTSAGIIQLLERNAWKTSRIALITSQQSNMIVRDFLQKKGYNYRLFTVYRSVALDSSALSKYMKRGCLGIVVTSSQEAETILKDHTLSEQISKAETRIFAIGKTTADTIRKMGFAPAEPVGSSILQDLICQIRERYLQK